MTIDGIYMSTVLRNEQTGYTIFKFKYYGPARDRYVIYVQGFIPIYTKDMPIEITGEFITKTKFKATRVIEKITDYDISVSFLSSKEFCGIGPKSAKLIVDNFGTDIFSLIEDDNIVEKFSSLKGISVSTAKNLVFKIRNIVMQRKVFEFFLRYKGTIIPALKLINKYADKTLDTLKDNPYIIQMNSDVSFYTADAIAKDLNFSFLDKKRIEGIIFEALKMSYNSGNTYITQKELNKLIKFIIKNSMFPEKIPITLFSTVMNKCKWLVMENTNNEIRIFFKNSYFHEKESARHLHRLNQHKIKFNFDENIIDEIENRFVIKYHEHQREVFDIIKDSGTKILTGGPGTGKTTLLKGLIEAFKTLNPDKKIILCSPTGRAAQRMKEQTGYPASTIHKLLEFKPFENSYIFKNNLDPIKADFIIIDEFSMIDIEIFSIFLDAITPNTLVLFVGDIEQLPSVGAGCVMRDLINSKCIKTYKLTNIYRQSSDSIIVDNANKIVVGNKNVKENEFFKIIRLAPNVSFNDKIIEIFKENKDFNVYNTQVLSTVRKDDGGIYQFNEVLKDYFNKKDDNLNFNIGDKIIVNKNNYELGVYNGDLGFVCDIIQDGLIVNINDEKVLIPSLNLDIISLAYAITVHKSQGSEFDNIIVALPNETENMLQRNLLYTAITRAKERVIILSKSNSFFKAIDNNSIIRRNTSLCEKVIELF